jgi:hypothetical protein
MTLCKARTGLEAFYEKTSHPGRDRRFGVYKAGTRLAML